jgi:hypothetical protein
MIKSYFSKKFATYMFKWQVGFFVAVPCMYFFGDVLHWPHWATTVAFQFIGSLIFWPIDNWIFRKKY